MNEVTKKYIKKMLKKDKLVLHCKLVPNQKRDYKVYICNIDDLIRWRVKNGITQVDFAKSKVLGISDAKTYQHLESAKIPLPANAIRVIRNENLIYINYIEDSNIQRPKVVNNDWYL